LLLRDFSAYAARNSPLTIESYDVCGLGGRAELNYNASTCGVTRNCGGTGPDWSSVVNFVYLYHELVHLYMYHIEGRRNSNPLLECMATGLGPYFRRRHNENKLRCELGLPVRPCYDLAACTRFPAPVCGPRTARSSHIARPSSSSSFDAGVVQDAGVPLPGGVP
jgi:hypothetical protein